MVLDRSNLFTRLNLLNSLGIQQSRGKDWPVKWYGTTDAIAPTETVLAGNDVPITIGVSADPHNQLEVRYRVDQGPTETITANWLRNDSSRNAQYFRAILPASRFRPGDLVEFTPICRCAGRQIPSAEEARRFPSSFRVVAPEAQAGSAPASKSPEPLRTRTSSVAQSTPTVSQRATSLPKAYLETTSRPLQTSRPVATEIPKAAESRATASPAPQPASPTLTEVANTLRLKLPQQLLPALAEHGIYSLADIRSAGGLGNLPKLAVPADHPAVKALEAHASLSILTSDIQLSGALVAKGYTSPLVIADTPRAQFVAAMSDQIGDFKAAQLHVMARAQTDYLNNVLTGFRANQANGFVEKVADPGIPSGGISLPAPVPCKCKDCDAVLSPLAYLADLLHYAVTHLRNSADGSPITLQTLTDAFRQPFGELSTSCVETSREVRQVRICIEVLRSYLGARPLSNPARATLAEAEKQYRLNAYTALLNKIGTSFEELRLARGAKPEKRKVLADRLGVDLDSATPDYLGALLIDPAADDTQPNAVTEQNLERLFGLPDTTRDPLSDGPTLHDPQGQITRWNLDGAEWGRNTDADGTVYVNLKHPSASVWRVELYRNSSRAAESLVASGEGSTSAGTVEVAEQNASGLSGSFDMAYTAYSSDIELSAISNIVSWRLKHLRTLWTNEDRLRRTPIIDPDLVNLGDLRDPTGSASTVWQARRSEVDSQQTTLRSLREATVGGSLAQLDAVLQAVLGVSSTYLLTLDDQRRQGDVTAELDRLGLTLDAFSYLLRIRNLVDSNASLLDSEWEDVYAILVQAWKHGTALSTWLDEERQQNLTLGPDYFKILEMGTTLGSSPPTFDLPAWRATWAARRDWQNTLQSRIDQQKAVIEAMGEAVRATEEATLAKLRGALIIATQDSQGGDLEAAGKRLAQRLLIDTRVSACQKTIRIEQAIETIQSALFGARTDELSGDVRLALESDNFDDEWQWMGSYANWRAAMTVFIYPENILLPSLRRWQTAAFQAMLQEFRSNPNFSPQQACASAAAYCDYFQAVCSIEVQASC